jgi:pimeloyl-ACP methyl ester carboxylesterase
MPYLKLDTHNLYYQYHNPRALSSPPLLLLHGLGSSGEDWPLQSVYFAEHFPVLSVDLRGHGRSDLGPGWPTLRDYASDMATLVEQLDCGEVHVVGLSLGGAVALQLALEHPEHIRSLTIVNAFARFQSGRRGMVRTLGRLFLLLIGRMDWLGAWIAAGIFPDPGQETWRALAAARIGANSRGRYARAVWAVMRFDVTSRLGEVRAPALIVAGERDTTVAMAAKELLAESIQGARLLKFPRSGHATPYDVAEDLNRALLAFLLEVEDQRSSG